MKHHDELINLLRGTLSKMELALGSINEAIVWTDESGLIQWCNKSFDQMINKSHIEILGKDIGKLLLLEQHGQAVSWPQQFKVTTQDSNHTDIYEYRNKKSFLQLCTKKLIIENKTFFIIVLQDVTKEQEYLKNIIIKEKLLQKQSLLLQKEKEYVENIIRSMSNMLVVVDSNGIIKTVNRAASIMLGYAREELIGKDINVIVKENESHKILANIISMKSMANLEVECKTKNGEVKPTLFSGSVIFDENGQISAIVTLAQDISERKEMENRLRYLSTHDSLTDLPNRALFEDRLEAAIQHSRHTHENMALLYMDLDYYKQVNDTLGHRIGDLLLVEVANRIKKTLLQDDLAVRLGGDEFAIILFELKTEEKAGEIAEKLLFYIQAPYFLEGNEVKITASIGIAFFQPTDNTPARDLKKNADLAMYKAKAAGRNTYSYYKEE